MTIMNRRTGREDKADMEPRVPADESAVAEMSEREDAVTIESDSEFDRGDDLNPISEAELRDFLAADVTDDVRADPQFKEGLRRKLWAYVSDRYGRDSIVPDKKR